MNRLIAAVIAPTLGITVATAMAGCSSSSAATPLPDPAVDIPLAKAGGVQTAVLAGGCFWGVEGVFEHVKGVTRVVSGYAGGKADTASYEKVSSGRTGHAESVRIVYDPARISYGQLLKVFFSVAHDPTELNRQGPDTGTQYRSAIFYANEDQKRVAETYTPHRHPDRALEGLLRCRGLPPELSGQSSEPTVHRHQRPAEDQQPETATSVLVCRQINRRN
jgi:peptide-methionine (S)-S-oxide reductase